MSQPLEPVESILIVDDEEPVRKTFCEWLEEAELDCRLLVAADAETALVLANQQTIDLAILDWNLGAGNDGLQLLEDLYLFNPEVIAIMVTGFAHQATPLDAMRMGVRDYFDKNQDLTRETFLAAVRRQLERIRPAKRARRLHQGLVAFREAVEKVLPLVQSAAALNDPVPLPEAIGSLFAFLLRTTEATDGVLLVRSFDTARQPPEVCRAYDSAGHALTVDLIPFASSIAGAVVGLQRPERIPRLDEAAAREALSLQPFERGKRSLLAAPLSVAPGIQVVLELFDKVPRGGAGEGSPFAEADQQLVAAAAEFGSELLRHALAQQQTYRLLLDAVAAALGASDSIAASLRGHREEGRDQSTPPGVLEQIRAGLASTQPAGTNSEQTLRLAEAIRMLTFRHGPGTLKHCLRLVDNLRDLLDSVTGEASGEW